MRKFHKFVDSVLVRAYAGNGGNGCASFRREKFLPRGGPNGGDGGDGGNVILRCDRDEDSLIRLYFAPHQRAENGEHGRGKDQYGRNGRDCVVKTPCGTEVWDTAAGNLLGDLIRHGDELVVARGGKGGFGNLHFKSPTHQAPTERTEGGRGEEVVLRLELKLVADVGLVGFPNAGKSSLLTRISGAHPKIAAYPFTTLSPIIGTLAFEDYTSLKVADLPGIIKDAHAGVGLGYSFLRHIERSSFLVYVIDMAGVDGRKPHEDYSALRKELKLYRKDLMERPSLIVANKMDMPEAAANLMEFKRKTRTKPIPVSAATGDGMPELKDAFHRMSARR